MAQELVFTVEHTKARETTPISFAEAGLREREDLQEWILAHPRILGEDVMVVSCEYDGFESPDGLPVYDRLDVLGLDRSGRLVVAELKRDKAPSTVTMQALNYAAMMSRFSVDEVAAIYAKFRRKGGHDADDPLAELREFAPEVDDSTLGPPAIVLVASDFAPQVTNTAMFLFENRIDIRLIQARLYRTDGGELLLTTSQLLPVPKAETFMMRARSSAVAQAVAREERARRASVPQLLVDTGRVAEGEKLRLVVPQYVQEDRDAIEEWLNEDSTRREVTWHRDPRRPLVWAFDGQGHSFADLIRRLVTEATQQPPRTQVWGPNWVTDKAGTTLDKIAKSLEDAPDS